MWLLFSSVCLRVPLLSWTIKIKRTVVMGVSSPPRQSRRISSQILNLITPAGALFQRRAPSQILGTWLRMFGFGGHPSARAMPLAGSSASAGQGPQFGVLCELPRPGTGSGTRGRAPDVCWVEPGGGLSPCAPLPRNSGVLRCCHLWGTPRPPWSECRY